MEKTTRWEPIMLGKARTLKELVRYQMDDYLLWCEKQGYYDLFFTSPKMSFEEWRAEYLEPWRKQSLVSDWFEEWIKMGEEEESKPFSWKVKY